MKTLFTALAVLLVSTTSLAGQIGTSDAQENIDNIGIMQKHDGSYQVVINATSEATILIAGNMSYADASAMAADFAKDNVNVICEMSIYPGHATDRLCSVVNVVGLGN